MLQIVDQAHKGGMFSCAWKDIECGDTADEEGEDVDEKGTAYELFSAVMAQNKASKRTLLERTFAACSKVCVAVCCCMLLYVAVCCV